uniref:Magnesium transporter n=1 Tax=Alexandrium catenella TaxID=2925 RepID=A0A7S1QL86_ALECA|mmetsp:Transcript_34433/g.93288  ORF Transcript_34433/g.93288 Transcript_34433/m.93288 type:complete len:370 (+) Transcript_34433:165-1274(+)
MWLTGVLICLVGSFFISLGLVLQKYSHLKEQGSGRGTPIYKNPWWVLGFSVYLSGQALNFVALAFAPQAMLSALGASSLVFLGILGWSALDERMQAFEIGALAFLVIGLTMVICAVPDATGGVHHNGSVHGIAGSLSEVDFLLTAVCFAAVVCLVRLSIELFSSPGFTTPRGIFWALATGVLSGYTFTLCKCLSMLLLTAHHTWVHWQLYVLALIMAGMCVVQVHTLNLALAMGSAKAVVPLTFSLGVLIQILNAQVAFEELSKMTRFVCFWIGVLSVLLSMAYIVQIQLSSDEEEEVSLEDSGAAEEQKYEASAVHRRSQTYFLAEGPTQMGRERHPRRHSSYFGLRNTGTCRGRVYPMGTGGLIIMT